MVAIIAILAALLFPVLAEARLSAYQATWIARHRQVGQAHQLYLTDYDDRFVLAAYSGRTPGSSASDRTWVQLLLPYAREFELFRCPIDPWAGFDSKSAFDEDLIPGDIWSRYYNASKRSNLGYNYAYLSPIFRDPNDEDGWVVISRFATEIENPSNTLIMIDSAYQIDKGGTASGGGSYIVLPPCRYRQGSDGLEDTFDPGDNGSEIFLGGLGKLGSRESPQLDGGVYSWFRDRVTLSFADGSVGTRPESYVHAGCEVKERWSGLIYNANDYPWDLN